MSKGGARWPLESAKAAALRLASVACGSPTVTRWAVAGSIRRQQPLVGDIDLVVQLAPNDPWALGTMTRTIEEHGFRFLRGGERILAFEHESEPNLDVYIATPETWGITLLVRTGSAAHNVKLVEAAKRLLPARTLTVSKGVLDTAGRVIASRTEEEIFRAIGVPYVLPASREAPEFQSWIRDE